MILDAYPVTAFLLAETVAEVIDPVRQAGPWVMTSVGLAEVVDVVVRLSGAPAGEVAADVAALGPAEIVAVDTALGVAAGALRAKHYHGTRRSVSLADCLTAALAAARAEPLATSDPHLLDLCDEEGIAVVPLPQSDGSVWTSRRDEGGSQPSQSPPGRSGG